MEIDCRKSESTEETTVIQDRWTGKGAENGQKENRLKYCNKDGIMWSVRERTRDENQARERRDGRCCKWVTLGDGGPVLASAQQADLKGPGGGGGRTPAVARPLRWFANVDTTCIETRDKRQGVGQKR
jgi:hypothetical protein